MRLPGKGGETGDRDDIDWADGSSPIGSEGFDGVCVHLHGVVDIRIRLTGDAALHGGGAHAHDVAGAVVAHGREIGDEGLIACSIDDKRSDECVGILEIFGRRGGWIVLSCGDLHHVDTFHFRLYFKAVGIGKNNKAGECKNQDCRDKFLHRTSNAPSEFPNSGLVLAAQ